MILSAILFVLAYPPFDVGLLGLVALVPWLQSLGTVLDENRPYRRAWWQGYWLGLLFFGGTIWWLVHVTIIGTIILVAVLALFFATFGLFAAWFLRGTFYKEKGSDPFSLAIVLAAAWTLLEWLRNTLFTGFGWNLLAHTQWRSPLLQLADLVGVYGVSWLVVFVNVSVWLIWRRIRDGSVARTVPVLTALVVVLAAAIGYGTWRTAVVERAVAHGPVLRVALVQGKIPQEQKWDAGYAIAIVKRYTDLTRRAARQGADVIIWPETAVPGLANEPAFTEWLGGLSREVGAPLLVGAPWEGNLVLYNSAVLVTPDGEIQDRYDKLHLVPFGEFIPGESWWPALGQMRERLPIGQFTPGNWFTVFTVPGSQRSAKMSALVCFEDLFPELARGFVRRGARLLATITNDAWFGRTAAPIQHTQPSVFRAVEHRVWMLRAANTGYTCAIDPAGRVVASVRGRSGALWVSGFRVVPVSLGSAGPTLYTRWGDWWLWVCTAILAAARLRRIII